MSFLRKIVDSEREEIVKDLLQENRALDMELMEVYERIRDLENQVAFLKKTVGIMEKMDKI